MIQEYHRPQTLEEAVRLIGRSEPPTTAILSSTRRVRRDGAVVDVQALGLDTYTPRGNFVDLGAALTLQALLEQCTAEALSTDNEQSVGLWKALQHAIEHEATYNLRGSATVAGTLLDADGRSPFATALLALDATLTLLGGEQTETVSLGDLLPLRSERLAQRLVTQVTLPLNVRLGYDYVARTPADLPIVCAAVAQWPSGRIRVALGGFSSAPFLALDGTETEGADIAARSAYSHAGDAWASVEYREEMAGVLVRRLIEVK